MSNDDANAGQTSKKIRELTKQRDELIETTTADQLEIYDLKRQRDELLAAIEQFLDPEGNPPADSGEWREVMRVIASVKAVQQAR